MPEVVVHDGLAEIGRAEWDACFPGEPEGYAYLRAVERAEIPGFRLFYVTVREAGRLVAAAPGFVTDYRLDTTLTGPLRRLVSAVDRLAPFLTRLKLACLGSPVTETALLGVAPDQAHRRGELLAALLSGLEQKARAEGVRLTAVKDIPAGPSPARLAAEAAGLSPMSSLPTAWLDLNAIPDEAAYWAKLSRATRKDLRRKLKTAAGLRIERIRDLSPYAERIDRLYAETRARAEMTFETLSWRYFQAVLENMGEDAACFLYFAGEELIAFNLLIGGDGAVVDKYFCAGARGRAFNLYFVSWLNNVRYALSSGATRLVAGQACYEPKLRLGCKLGPTAIWFRHRLAPVNAALRLAGRSLGVEETDPALKAALNSPPAKRGEGTTRRVVRGATGAPPFSIVDADAPSTASRSPSPADAGEEITVRPAKARIPA